MVLRALALAAILAAVSSPASASWSTQARNGKLAFVAGGRIWTVNADGSDLAALTSSAFRETDPTWSPEGTRIVFASTRSGAHELWIIDADGSGVRRITRSRSGTADSGPSLSPDGRRVAFVRRIRGDRELYVANLDGSGVRRLTRHRGLDTDPAWSPDGTRIVFARAVGTRGRRTTQLFSVGPDGRGLRRLTWGAPSRGPAWSPDGNRVVFSRAHGPANRGDLAVLRVDTAELTRLTRGPANDVDPAWSPDGDAIAFTSDRAERTPNVFVIAAAGSASAPLRRVTTLHEGRAGAKAPSWQPVP